MENICKKRPYNGKNSPIWPQTEFLIEKNRHVQILKEIEHISKTCSALITQN